MNTVDFEVNPFALAHQWVEIMDELRLARSVSSQDALLSARREIEAVAQQAGLDKMVSAAIKQIRGL